MHLIGLWNRPGGAVAEFQGGFRLQDLELHLGESIARLQNDDVLLAYKGKIFDRSEKELLEVPIAIETAYGVYSYVKIWKHENRIEIGADRLGLGGLFYSIDGPSLSFASSLTALKYCIDELSPDYEAWDEIFNFGDVLGEKTVLRGVKRLRHGTKIRIEKGRIHVDTVWSADHPPFMDPASFVKKNNELLAEAMRLTRSTTERRVLLLSAGEDSRRLAIMARETNLLVECWTQSAISGTGNDLESGIAGQVANRLGFPHFIEPLPTKEQLFDDGLVRDYLLGFETSQHDWIIPLLRGMDGGGLVYDGIVGDVILNGHFLKRYPRSVLSGSVDALAELLVPAQTIELDSSLVDTPLFERIRAELSMFPDSPHRFTFFWLFNHTRRTIASRFELFHFFNHNVCCPYANYALFWQSLALDPKLQLNQRFQNICMHEINSAVASLSTTRDSSNIDSAHIRNYKGEDRAREIFAFDNARIREQVISVVPSLARRVKMYRVLKEIGAATPFRNRMWWIEPLTRMSRFFDWIEEKEKPPFLSSDHDYPAYLEKQFVTGSRPQK